MSQPGNTKTVGNKVAIDPQLVAEKGEDTMAENTKMVVDETRRRRYQWRRQGVDASVVGGGKPKVAIKKRTPYEKGSKNLFIMVANPPNAQENPHFVGETPTLEGRKASMEEGCSQGGRGRCFWRVLFSARVAGVFNYFLEWANSRIKASTVKSNAIEHCKMGPASAPICHGLA